MKKIFLTITSLSILALIFSFQSGFSTITGKITPAEGAEAVWAIYKTDSVKSPITLGMFNLAVKPGTYRVFIDAKEPYQDLTIENVEIQGMKADLGEITLKQ